MVSTLAVYVHFTSIKEIKLTNKHILAVNATSQTEDFFCLMFETFSCVTFGTSQNESLALSYLYCIAFHVDKE